MTSPTLVRTSRLREQVLDAGAQGRGLRITGSGSWLEANRPVRAPAMISTQDLRDIVAYVPGDLTITVEAGATLRDLARVTRDAGQWSALEPFGGVDGTIGATVATGSSGPLALHFGTPRDIVLGLQFITGTGAVVRGGGRVVKNVAGYDLTRLLTGSWGSLGVITEVTLRLRACPEVDDSASLPVDDAPAPLRVLHGRLARLPFVPFAAELVSGVLAARLGVGTGPSLLIRWGGSAAAARAQRASIEALGDARDVSPGVWEDLRVAEPATAVVVRLSQRVSDFPDSWAAARALTAAWTGTADENGGMSFSHGSLGRGIVRCVLPFGSGDEERLPPALALPFAGTRVFEKLPASLWPACAPGPLSDRLSRGIKTAYDPFGIMNPGILGESR